MGTHDVSAIYIIKGDMFICLSVCCQWPAERLAAGPIKTKLYIGTHVDPWSVLVKVKVIWRHLANNNEICAQYQQ